MLPDAQHIAGQATTGVTPLERIRKIGPVLGRGSCVHARQYYSRQINIPHFTNAYI